LAGIGPAIAAITDRAMRGELDFAQALAERLSLLADEPVSLFETVLAGLELSPGAQTLVATMRQNGAYCALVSGGLEPLVGSVAKQLGFHECHANGLDMANGRLTGKVKEPVFGPDGKRETLRRLVKTRGIGLADTLAVGDGANDIPMLRDAGLGVAYHGKPATVAAANHQIRFGDLTTLLYFQGFRPAEFVTPTD
ncbi:MAG: phosphoserine phosphatase SerB, partial [Pseudomonadota bacterium]